MAHAETLRDYLDSHRLAYEIIDHAPTDSLQKTAKLTQVPTEQVAKSTLLGDDLSYLLAVIPASNRLQLDRLNRMIARNLEVVRKDEAESAFTDCDASALPPLGEPYGVETVVDPSLIEQNDVYFECGDHEHMVHMKGDDFRHLMEQVPRLHLSHHY